MQSPEPVAPQPRFLGVADAARHVGVSPDTIRAWLAAQHLTRYSAGRKILIDREQLERMVLTTAG